MFKFLFYSALAIAAAIAIIYFLPSETKINALEQLTDFVPESVKEKVDDLLLTPPEKRAKILEKLEKNLADAETALADNAVSATEAKTLSETIASAEKQLEELKTKNNDASLTSIVTTKLVEQLLNKNATTTCKQ